MYKRRRVTQGTRYAYQSRTKYQRRGNYTPKPGFTRTAGFYGRYNRASLKSTVAVNELKFKDTNLGATVITDTGVILPATEKTFVQIPIGTGPSERIGRQINVKSLNAYSTLYKIATTVSETINVRLIWFIDTQCNGQAPAITDVLQTANINSFRNMANSRRFKVLKDQEYVLTSQNWDGSQFSSVKRQVNVFAKMNTPIEYDASLTTGAITTIRSNNILMLAISDTGNVAQLLGTVRIRYDD